ncbi:60S ribosomal protein [Colletotrichum tofieldiae]|nr:60S ribosomal protein [Colletotrichum tofieldiae]
MEARTLTRPATALATLLRQQTATAVPRRGHKTFSRTKRSLNIPPHPDFLPSTPAAGDAIIYNPPSAAPSVYHTPFKFLPPSDPRRRANLSSLFANPSAATSQTTSSGSSSAARPLPRPSTSPPAAPSRATTSLAKTSPRSAASAPRTRASGASPPSRANLHHHLHPAPREHKERLERKLEGVKSRWGTIRTKAREDRSRRKEMLFRGEL